MAPLPTVMQKFNIIISVYMKTLFICLALLLTENLFAQNLPAPPEGKAAVYFIRYGNFGTGVRFAHFDGDQFIGKFSGNRYLRYECEPGSHLFWARSENRDFVPSDLEAGQIYFIEAVVNPGLGKAHVKLLPMDPNEIQRIAKFEKKVQRKKALTYTPAQLAHQTQKRQKGIQKALARYEELSKEGKEFRRLEANMYKGNIHQ